MAKKIRALLALVLSLSGCGNKGNEANDTSTTTYWQKTYADRFITQVYDEENSYRSTPYWYIAGDREKTRTPNENDIFITDKESCKYTCRFAVINNDKYQVLAGGYNSLSITERTVHITFGSNEYTYRSVNTIATFDLHTIYENFKYLYDGSLSNNQSKRLRIIYADNYPLGENIRKEREITYSSVSKGTLIQLAIDEAII